MNEKVYYKVLLVDDNKRLGESLQPKAEQYGLDLRQVVCWADAKEQLDNRDDFERWSAIILDANCTFEKDAIPDLHFLDKVLEKLQGLFERHVSQIPWFVLTAGGKSDFEFVREGILSRERDKSWGDVFYFKDKPDENGKDQVEILFENIQRIAPLSEKNKIKFRYKNVFDVLKEHFDKQGESEGLMLDLLTELHFPKKNFEPVNYYNRLRKVVECLFRACNKIGLLPDDFIDADHKINSVQEASLYLAGKVSDHLHIRYGEEGESVFPRIIAEIVKRILNVTNRHSHTAEIEEEEREELNAYCQEVHSCNMLFGYALQLCDVIEWFGNYAENHSDKEANLNKRVVLDNPHHYEDKTFDLEADNGGNLHCQCCMVSYLKHKDNKGKKVRLSDIVPNTNKDDSLKKKYPLFANTVELVTE